MIRKNITLKKGSKEWYEYYAPYGVEIEMKVTFENNSKQSRVTFIISLQKIKMSVALVQKACAELVIPGDDWMMIIKP